MSLFFLNNVETPTWRVKNVTSLIKQRAFYLQQEIFSSSKLSHPSEGADNGAGSTPVPILPVLAGSKEVLSPPVVGILIKDEVAVHDVTRVDMAVVETVGHAGTVVHEFHHVPAKVRLLVDTQSVRASVLWSDMDKINFQWKKIIKYRII